MSRVLTAAALTALTCGVGQAQTIFAPLPAVPHVASDSYGFVGGDFDEDGLNDLLVRRFSGGAEEIVLPGLGDGSFGAPVVSSVFLTSERRVGDVDADGHLDVVATDAFTLTLVLGLGDGTFEAGDLFPIAGVFGLSATLELADVDGDGDLDVLLVKRSYFGDTSDSVPVYDFAASGEFTLIGRVGASPFSGTPGQLALADFDEDGRLDAVITYDGNSAIGPGAGARLYTGDGSGGFPPPGATLFEIGTSETFGAVVAADFDGDGHADIAATDPDSQTLLVQLGDGRGGFTPTAALPLAKPPGRLRAADLDADGIPDLVVFWRTEFLPVLPAEARVFHGQGDGTFLQSTTFTLSQTDDTMRGDLVDMDADGLDDLVAASLSGFPFDQHIGVAFNRTDVGGLPILDLGSALPGTAGYPIQLAEGDFAAGAPISVDLFGAPPGAAVFQVLGLRAAGLPLLGGTLVPAPDRVRGPFPADGSGSLLQSGVLPPGIPSGLELHSQFWFPDVAGPSGWAASSGVRITMP